MNLLLLIKMTTKLSPLELTWLLKYAFSWKISYWLFLAYKKLNNMLINLVLHTIFIFHGMRTKPCAHISVSAYGCRHVRAISSLRLIRGQ